MNMANLFDTYHVIGHDAEAMSDPALLTVSHVTRHFMPVDDDDDVCPVRSRFYAHGEVRLRLDWLCDSHLPSRPVGLCLSPDMAHYLARALSLAASDIESEYGGLPKRTFGGSSYGSSVIASIS